jgi:transposase
MGKNTGPKKVRRYTNEFKIKAVKLSELDDVQVKDVAEELGIHPFMLSRWRKEAREGKLKARASVAPNARQKKEIQQFAELKRQYAILKEEHELLKKLIRFCAARKKKPLSSSTRRGTDTA